MFCKGVADGEGEVGLRLHLRLHWQRQRHALCPRGGLSIPFICHFFTQTKFLENKIYTEKSQFFEIYLYKTPHLRIKSVKNANFLR